MMLRRLAWPLVALVISACGANPAPTQPEPSDEPAPQAPIASPPSAPGAAQDGKAFVAKSQAGFKAMLGYETEMSYFQKKGAKSASGVYLLRGKQPRKLRIEIKQGNSQGTKLSWTGGSKIKVRPGGLLSAIALDLPLDDDRIISVRGYTLDQTDLPAMYTMMLDPANATTMTAPGIVTVTGPRLLKGCVRMVAQFDPVTALPSNVELSDAKEVVFRMRLKNFHRNDRVSLDI